MRQGESFEELHARQSHDQGFRLGDELIPTLLRLGEKLEGLLTEEELAIYRGSVAAHQKGHPEMRLMAREYALYGALTLEGRKRLEALLAAAKRTLAKKEGASQSEGNGLVVTVRRWAQNLGIF